MSLHSVWIRGLQMILVVRTLSVDPRFDFLLRRLPLALERVKL